MVYWGQRATRAGNETSPQRFAVRPVPWGGSAVRHLAETESLVCAAAGGTDKATKEIAINNVEAEVPARIPRVTRDMRDMSCLLGRRKYRQKPALNGNGNLYKGAHPKGALRWQLPLTFEVEI